MKISSKTKEELYLAIYDEIMQLRIKLYKKKHDNELDSKLSVSVDKIWKRQKDALRIKTP